MAADAVECCDLARTVAIRLTHAQDDGSRCRHHSPDDDSRIPCGEDTLSMLPMPHALWFASHVVVCNRVDDGEQNRPTAHTQVGTRVDELLYV